MNPLFETFPKPDKEEWKKAASAEINGSDPFETLRWKTTDEQELLPFYSNDDVKTLEYLQRIAFINRAGGLTGARTWANLPPVEVSDNDKANALILEHLSNEAEGVLVYPASTPDYNKLLENVSWQHCTVSYVGDNNFDAEALIAYIRNKKYDPAALQGAIFWKTETAKKCDLLPNSAFLQAGLFIEPSTPVNEVGIALSRAIQTIDAFAEYSVKPEAVIKHIAFSLPVQSNLLPEIAKLKALRLLWYQITQAYGVKDYDINSLHLHGRSEVWINAAFQPHGNMLKGTLAAIAALAGTCNAITIHPEDNSNSTQRRIARNTSAILKDESQFSRTNDPFAGAYAVDVLVDQIARDAWKKFQTQTYLEYEARL